MKCFTAEQTKLYERGYPHLVTLGADAKKVDLVKIYNKPWGLYHVEWPRNVATAFARVGIGNEGGFGLPEARAAIERRLASPRRLVVNADRHFLFCVEALVGTDPTLEILVSALETLPEDRWSTPGSPFDPATKEKHDQMDPAIHAMNTVIENGNTGYLAYLSGYLLLRASPDAAAKSRARLEALWQRTVDANAFVLEETLRGGLDLALHGNEGARRVFPTSHWQYLHWWDFVDDAGLFRARLANRNKSEWIPDARHLFLCPDLVDRYFEKKAMRSLGDRRARFLEEVGMFDHPAIEPLMREWSTDKKSGAVAAKWLADHGKH